MIEYRGAAIRSLSMEGRMTVCNMSIEAGARAGMVAPDDTTFAYVEGRPHAPTGADWERALEDWRTLPTDAGATFDREVTLDATELKPFVCWGRTPASPSRSTARSPTPTASPSPASARRPRAPSRTWIWRPVTPIRDIRPDTVFIGSCTNSRMEDLRVAAEVLGGRTVAAGLRALVVPGSFAVKPEAEREGLDTVFERRRVRVAGRRLLDVPGHEPRQLHPGDRSARTSNRNFEGRQGKGGRTHLVSPAVAAATAILGRFGTPDELEAI